MLKIISSLFLLLFLLVAAQGFAGEIKAPPQCFEKQDYCSTADVQRSATGQRFIQIKFHAQLANEFESVEEIVEKFTVFHKWMDYSSGSTNIDVISSGLLRSGRHQGLRQLTQYSRYMIKAPWPVSQIEVVERTTYREKKPGISDRVYWSFHSDRDFAHKGIVRKDGTIRVQFNAPLNVYYVEVLMDVVPTTSMVTAARKPIQNALSELFLGMFGLN